MKKKTTNLRGRADDDSSDGDVDFGLGSFSLLFTSFFFILLEQIAAMGAILIINVEVRQKFNRCF